MEENKLNKKIVEFLRNFATLLHETYKKLEEENFAFFDHNKKSEYPVIFTKNYALTKNDKYDKFSVFINIESDRKEIALDIKRLEKFAQEREEFDFDIASQYLFADLKNGVML